ncbi:MAG: PBSX family phage terminase large subunit [Oscillospiraceae bacterium]|nr:PBSX family phage terminase large subunit [Oscillospiraceae bacterium]
MEFKEFSKKQLRALTWWCPGSSDNKKDAVICDGAVRSGKTVCMSLSFVLWAMSCFGGASFALCGKTITSLRRNVIIPVLPVLRDMGFSCEEKLSQNLVVISYKGAVNRFYIFGGRDESSASLIQGMTLGGVLLDEVALMPRSFVEQAIARCSVQGSKLWFNCNPENPLHWFHTEWIEKAAEKNCLYLHFTMNDNPSLSKTIIERYKSLYSGAFFERFVEGKWVAAEGLVYPFFNQKLHTAKTVPPCEKYYISCDYGTVNPASFGLWGLSDGIWFRANEYYHDSKRENCQKTDEEYYKELENLAEDKNIKAVIVDPSAVSFIECTRRHGRFNVIPAKNDVTDGIRRVSDALKSGKLIICRPCADIIREFGLYRWDDNAKRDAPRKEHDHAMDDMRYFVATVLSNQEDGFFAIAAER